MTALKAKEEGKVVPQVIGEMRSMGVQESFACGMLDRYEVKNIDIAIQVMCKLRGLVQVIDPELPEPKLDTPRTTQTTQSIDKKSKD